jgi:hypothetical protein
MESEGLEPLLCGSDFGFTKSFDLTVTHDFCSFFTSTMVPDSLLRRRAIASFGPRGGRRA